MKETSMKHIDTCDICQQKARGKRYDFYYGQFLGNTDVAYGGPGGINKWTENYLILENQAVLSVKSASLVNFGNEFSQNHDLTKCRYDGFHWNSYS
jgi:hypothetical protein